MLKKLNLFVPPPPKQGIGGPITFLRNLHRGLGELGLRSSRKKKNIFFPIQYDMNLLKKIARHKGHVIQRLDGVYYPSKHGELYIRKNKNIEYIYKNLATHVIFQSEYSKKQCLAMFGAPPSYSIICNGVNKKVFHPVNKLEVKRKHTFITTGNFRNLDMIKPVVEALDILNECYEFEFRVLGPVPNKNLNQYLDRSYINYLGESHDQRKIAKALQESDCFIYSHLNPPCPNSVIEAISCGLPVIGYDSGAMKELCFFNQDLLVPVNGSVFHKLEDLNPNDLYEMLSMYLKYHPRFQKKALENAHLYSLRETAAHYKKVFTELCGYSWF